MIKLKDILKEINGTSTLSLYHGTCKYSGDKLIQFGWEPMRVYQGSNMGNPKYLYLTSGIEDAEWFANEKGCDTIVQVKDIPLTYLKPDPEDEAGYSMEELIDRMKTIRPSKFVLIQRLDSSHFDLI